MSSPTDAPPPSNAAPAAPTPQRPRFVPQRTLYWVLLAVYFIWIGALWWMWTTTRPR